MDLEMFRSMTPEEKAKTLRDPNLVKNVKSQFAKPLSMETTYEKNLSPYSTYTQNGKISERVGRLLKNLAGNPKGMGRKDAEPSSYMATDAENQNNALAGGAQNIMDPNGKLLMTPIVDKVVGDEKINSTAGVIMTPEVVESLKTQSDALANKRIDLERERRMNEYDQRARARRMKVQDTLEKTGLDRR